MADALPEAGLLPLVGLIGGLGPAATVHYYKRLLAEAERLAVPLRLFINHADVERVLALAGRDEREALADYLAARAGELERAGAAVLAVGAVTPHLCAAELKPRLRARFVDLIDALSMELERQGLERVVVLGTRTVMQTRLFGRVSQAAPAPAAAVMDRIHELYVSIVRNGDADPATTATLAEIAHDLLGQNRAQAVVLAGTELSLAPRDGWGDLPILDCAQIHVRAIIAAAA